MAGNATEGIASITTLLKELDQKTTEEVRNYTVDIKDETKQPDSRTKPMRTPANGDCQPYALFIAMYNLLHGGLPVHVTQVGMKKKDEKLMVQIGQQMRRDIQAYILDNWSKECAVDMGRSKWHEMMSREHDIHGEWGNDAKGRMCRCELHTHHAHALCTYYIHAMY